MLLANSSAFSCSLDVSTGSHFRGFFTFILRLAVSSLLLVSVTEAVFTG